MSKPTKFENIYKKHKKEEQSEYELVAALIAGELQKLQIIPKSYSGYYKFQMMDSDLYRSYDNYLDSLFY